MLEINTTLGNFKSLNGLILEMKHLNITRVEAEITYCLQTIQDKKEMSLEELEELKQGLIAYIEKVNL